MSAVDEDDTELAGRTEDNRWVNFPGPAGLIGRFVDVGASKFVVIPMVEPASSADWVSHLHDAADVLLPLQN